MATTTIQIGFGVEKMVLLAQLKKADGVPSDPDKSGYLSDDMYAKKLLIEKMDEKLLKLKPAKKGLIIMADETKQKGTLVNILDLPEAEITKGIQFNPDVEYDFEISEVQARKLVVQKDGHDKEFVVIDAHCNEATQDATLKMSFFYNDKVVIDAENPKRESPIVKFARGIGYPVSLGKKIKFGEIIRPGITFKAHTRFQIDTKTGKESVYSEINFDTIKGSKKGAKAQTKIADDVNPAVAKEIQSFAANYTKFEHLVQGLVAASRSDLISPASSLDREGKLTYAKA